MSEENKVAFKLTPFVALSILSLASIHEKKLPIGDKLRVAIEEFRDEAVKQMTEEDIDEAFIEKEIYEALKNIET